MPSFKIVTDEDAVADLRYAKAWYTDITPALGEKFVKQVKSQINLLKTHPRAYSVRYKTVRCMSIRKFPYLVHYTINVRKKTVTILAILNTSLGTTRLKN